MLNDGPPDFFWWLFSYCEDRLHRYFVGFWQKKWDFDGVISIFFVILHAENGLICPLVKI